MTGSNSKASAASSERTGPLHGVRVIDFTRILSGPFATMTLGDLGAEVIKLEQPGKGDDTRSWGPPFVGGESAYFLSVNRNKRSIAIDLKTPEGVQIVQSLVATADVVVENFRPGTMERMGLGFHDLTKVNPKLVYASISGYGQTGPDAGKPGYDAIAQARSGVMSVTGEADGSPVRVGFSSADIAAGMWTVIGILAALNETQRGEPGQWIDVSLLDGSLAWLTYVAGGYFAGGAVPQRWGSAHPTIAPYQALPTADGHVMVAVGNDDLWVRFTSAIARGDLETDPRFETNSQRVQNRHELIGDLEREFVARDTEHWVKTLEKAGVPVGPIHTVEQALRDPQVVEREMIEDTPHPTAGVVRTIACPVKFSRSPVSVRSAPPLHGQQTADILAELGLDSHAVEALRRKGAVS